MYSIMFSLTLMDFTVLESTENGKKHYTLTTKMTSHWFYYKQKAFRKETREKHGFSSIPFFKRKRFPGYIFFRNISKYA